MHFFNLFLFSRFRRRAINRMPNAPPPIPPTGFLHVAGGTRGDQAHGLLRCALRALLRGAQLAGRRAARSLMPLDVPSEGRPPTPPPPARRRRSRRRRGYGGDVVRRQRLAHGPLGAGGLPPVVVSAGGARCCCRRRGPCSPRCPSIADAVVPAGTDRRTRNETRWPPKSRARRSSKPRWSCSASAASPRPPCATSRRARASRPASRTTTSNPRTPSCWRSTSARRTTSPRCSSDAQKDRNLASRLQALIETKFRYFKPDRPVPRRPHGACRRSRPVRCRRSASRHARPREFDFAQFERALEETSTAVPKDLAPHIAKILWFYQMGLLLFWIYDRWPDQRLSRGLLREEPQSRRDAAQAL